MSIRKGAPYDDAIDEKTGALIYEGHDVPHTKDCVNPKAVDAAAHDSERFMDREWKIFPSRHGLQKRPA